jgi:hypothetical protein
VLQRLKTIVDTGVPAGVLAMGLCVLAIVSTVIGDNASRSAPLPTEPAEAVNAANASLTEPTETVNQRMDALQHRLEEVEKRLPKTVPDPHPSKVEKTAKIVHVRRRYHSCCCPPWWW